MTTRPAVRPVGRSRSGPVLLALLVAALAVATGFALAVLAGAPGGDLLHEVAGSLLLGLLLPAWGLAHARRHGDPALWLRVSAALVALLAMGATGALLAVGWIPIGWAGLPLVPLGLLVIATADALRRLVGGGSNRARLVAERELEASL
jgi:hypothetical protein